MTKLGYILVCILFLGAMAFIIDSRNADAAAKARSAAYAQGLADGKAQARGTELPGTRAAAEASCEEKMTEPGVTLCKVTDFVYSVPESDAVYGEYVFLIDYETPNGKGKGLLMVLTEGNEVVRVR